VLIRLPQQAEEPTQGFDDRGDPFFAHAFGWRLGEAEPSLRRLLDRGGLADPASNKRRVAAGVEGGAVASNLRVTVADRLAKPWCLVVLVMLSEGGAVASLAMRCSVSVRLVFPSSSLRNRSTGSVIDSCRR